MKNINKDCFNHVLSNSLPSELTRDELQEFTERLLTMLRESLKNTDDWYFQESLFKQQVSNMKEDTYWLRELTKHYKVK